MQFVLVSLVAGLVGTCGMTIVLWLIDRSGWANADMVRALGSALTRSYSRSVGPGLVFHFAAGIPFAMLYLLALAYLQAHGAALAMLFGGVIGFAHGVAFSFVLGILAEHHPVEEFKKAGPAVALAHLAGHIVYGILLGLVMGVSGYLPAA
jgi:hypothetical protein